MVPTCEQKIKSLRLGFFIEKPRFLFSIHLLDGSTLPPYGASRLHDDTHSLIEHIVGEEKGVMLPDIKAFCLSNVKLLVITDAHDNCTRRVHYAA